MDLQAGLDAVRIVRFQQFDIGVVEAVVGTDGRDLYALHQAKIVCLDGIELVEKVAGIPVRRAVAQRHQGIKAANGAARLPGAVRALRFVDDDDRANCPDEFNRSPSGHAVSFAVDDIELLQFVLGHLRQCSVGDILPEGLDVDDHDLNLVAHRELAQFSESSGVVDEMLEGRVLVERLEMLLHHVDALEHALADGDARHDNDEFLESVCLVQLENGAQIDIGFSGSGLHFDGQVRPVRKELLVFRPIRTGRRLHDALGSRWPNAGRGLFDAVALLHAMDVPRQLAFRDQQAIGDAEFGLKQASGLECIERRSLGAGEWLAIERVHDGIDRVKLILKRRIKSKLHSAAHTVRKTISGLPVCARALNA